MKYNEAVEHVIKTKQQCKTITDKGAFIMKNYGNNIVICKNGAGMDLIPFELFNSCWEVDYIPVTIEQAFEAYRTGKEIMHKFDSQSQASNHDISKTYKIFDCQEIAPRRLMHGKWYIL